jgi:hypothetical protein
MPKRVDLTIPPPATNNVVEVCCNLAGKGAARPAVRHLEDGGKAYGYVFEFTACACPSRWIPHDWRQGHATFHTHRPTANADHHTGPAT